MTAAQEQGAAVIRTGKAIPIRRCCMTGPFIHTPPAPSFAAALVEEGSLRAADLAELSAMFRVEEK